MMKIIEKLKKFWNVTLGPDYSEEQIDLETTADPKWKDLKEALYNVKMMEPNQKTSNASKGGKGNSRMNVEKVEIDPNTAQRAMENAQRIEVSEERDK